MPLRRTPDDLVLESATAGRLRGPAGQVWDLVRSPRSSVVLQRRCVDAWREPGCPSGVGEVQVHRVRVVTVEVRTQTIAYEEGRRAVTRALDMPQEIYVETTLSEEDEHGFVVLGHRSRLVLPAGSLMRTTRVKQRQLDAWAAEIASRLPRLCSG